MTEREPITWLSSNRTMPPCTVIPVLVYDDVCEAADWLCDTFGFVERWRVGDHRAQLSFDGGAVAITEPRTSQARPGPRDIMVRVGDVNAHHDRVLDRGATIIAVPRDFPYGERQYTVEDLGGHHWTFSESIADLAPEEWGATSGPGLEPSTAPVTLGRSFSPEPLISVMLIVPNGDVAVTWYHDALGASVLWDLGGVAGLSVAGAPFFIHEDDPENSAESPPGQIGATSTRIEVFVEDPDGFIARAIAAGATAGSAVTEHQMPWGVHRQGGFRDPFGHNWSVGDPTPLQRHR